MCKGAKRLGERVFTPGKIHRHPVGQLPDVVSPRPAHRAAVPAAIGLLSDEEPCALLYDMDHLHSVLRSIRDSFPASTLHAIAMKANPLVACLNVAKELGMGCEVASPAELEHALRIGFAPDKIVFDSPCKTRRDLRKALEAGVALNADNFDELARIDGILAESFDGGGARGAGRCASRIGVRVNPQYGEGRIACGPPDLSS